MSVAETRQQLDELLDLQSGAERCPHLGWAALRREGSVVWVERLNAYVVTRYDDVEAVLADPVGFASGLGNPQGPNISAKLAEMRAELARTSEEFQGLLELLKPDWRGQQVLLSADGVDHTRHRALVAGMFSARRAAALEPWVSEVADAILDDLEASLPEQPVHELFTEYCMALPVKVIAAQLGVEEERIPDFLRWSVHANMHMGNDHFDAAHVLDHTRSNVEFSTYFRPLLAARRLDPRDDFATKVALASDEEFHLNEELRLAIISQMLNAGHETSSKTMAEGVSRLAEDPRLTARLRAHPDEIATFVEEILRLAAPTQGLYRTVAEDTTLGGVELPAGAPLLVLYASANRTEDVFPEPDEVDLDRGNSATHLSFGKGKHFCPGAALARVVIRVGIERLLARMPVWTVAETAGGSEFNPSYLLHGRNAIWVRFETPAS